MISTGEIITRAINDTATVQPSGQRNNSLDARTERAIDLFNATHSI
jgi:hypothetical protein